MLNWHQTCLSNVKFSNLPALFVKGHGSLSHTTTHSNIRTNPNPPHQDTSPLILWHRGGSERMTPGEEAPRRVIWASSGGPRRASPTEESQSQGTVEWSQSHGTVEWRQSLRGERRCTAYPPGRFLGEMEGHSWPPTPEVGLHFGTISLEVTIWRPCKDAVC